MKIFQGKSPADRNKTIAALVLGVMVLIVIFYNFSGLFFGGKKTVTVKTSPTPAKTSSPGANNQQISNLPTQEEIDNGYAGTVISYNPNSSYAPDAGRNIFAFYEPPPPTPYSPTPTPTEKPFIPPTPVVTPTPPQIIGFVSPQSVYSGAKSFLLEVNGDKFTPDTRIIFNGNEIPTTYVNPQRLTANIAANFISGEGQRLIMTRSADGKLYSNQVSINVQAPPIPQFQYIGLLARQRYNNDTAYFQEQGKTVPFTARLNDVVGGRFRLVSISSAETIFEDVNLGFKHKLQLYRPSPGQTNNTKTDNNQQYNNPNYNNPNVPQNNGNCIPGIPCNIPLYNPNNTNVPPLMQQLPQKRDKVEDEDDDDGNN